jgi:hypothetical protein
MAFLATRSQALPRCAPASVVLAGLAGLPEPARSLLPNRCRGATPNLWIREFLGGFGTSAGERSVDDGLLFHVKRRELERATFVGAGVGGCVVQLAPSFRAQRCAPLVRMLVAVSSAAIQPSVRCGALRWGGSSLPPMPRCTGASWPMPGDRCRVRGGCPVPGGWALAACLVRGEGG